MMTKKWCVSCCFHEDDNGGGGGGDDYGADADSFNDYTIICLYSANCTSYVVHRRDNNTALG